MKMIIKYGIVSVLLVSFTSFAVANSSNTQYRLRVGGNVVGNASSPLVNINPTKTKTAAKPKLKGIAAIRDANIKSTKKPVSSDYFGAMMTYNYIPGQLFKIYCAPMSVTDVQIQKEENIISIAGGDTLRWQVSKTYSGSDENRQEHILIKPTDSGLRNTLVVTTDRRTYHILLESTESTYMAAVQWRYPESDDFVHRYSNHLAQQNIGGRINLQKLDFNYQFHIVNADKMRIAKPDWLPKTVFNDGHKTYVQFPQNMQEAPTLFAGSVGDTRVVNYRLRGDYYVIDGVYQDLILTSGQHFPIVVAITHG